MLYFLIDNRPAILKSGTSIKLTRENTYYAETGDYTLDVMLPLAGCPANIAIFGALHRPEASLKPAAKMRHTFKLQTGTLSLAGEARITSASEREVKVQLVAGKALMNTAAGEDGAKLYIDEMNLGVAWLAEAGMDGRLEYDAPLQNIRSTKKAVIDYLNAVGAPDVSETEVDKRLHGPSDEVDFVAFPVWSTADEAWANPHDYAFWGNSLDSSEEWPYHWHTTRRTWRFALRHERTVQMPGVYTPRASGENFKVIDYDNTVLAPQPYLCHVVECIARAMGYELKREDNILRKGWMAKLFVVNTRDSLYTADALPHWTLKEFFDELRASLNVVIVTEGTSARMESRASIYEQEQAVIELSQVADERQADYEESDETSDTSTGNVGYDLGDCVPRVFNLGEEIYERMDIRRFGSMEEINADFQAALESLTPTSNLLYILEMTGQRFAAFKYDNETAPRLREVDHAGALLREKTAAVSKLLKVVPATMERDVISSLVKVYKNGTFYQISNISPKEPNIPALAKEEDGVQGKYLVSDDTTASVARVFSLQQELAENTGEETDGTASYDKAEKLTLALNAGNLDTHAYHPNAGLDKDYKDTALTAYPVGIPYWLKGDYPTEPDSEVVHEPEGDYLLLRNPESDMAQNLARRAVDTRLTLQLQFIDPVTSPTGVFLYRGRRYVCQKLEITIDEHGVQPLKTGYFYEIE